MLLQSLVLDLFCTAGVVRQLLVEERKKEEKETKGGDQVGQFKNLATEGGSFQTGRIFLRLIVTALVSTGMKVSLT